METIKSQYYIKFLIYFGVLQWECFIFQGVVQELKYYTNPSEAESFECLVSIFCLVDWVIVI